MKRTIFVFCVLLVGLMLAGCDEEKFVLSLKPLYEGDAKIYDPALLGHWESPEFSLTFTGQGETLQGTFVYQKKGVDKTSQKSGSFDAALVRVGNVFYLDLLPLKMNIDNPIYESQLLQCHAFYRVALKDNTLDFSSLDPTWLRNASAANPDQIQIKEGERAVIFMGPARKIRDFLAKNQNTIPFINTISFEKQKNGGQQDAK